MAFHFEKPAEFTYKAGQNLDMFLIDPPETDAEGNKRTFSLVSSPSEDKITVATRMRNTAFKRVLKQMTPGEEVEIDGPYGDVYLPNSTERPAVLLAGGIGITLFHSMIKDATERKLAHKIFLFYSNRRPEDAAFLSELQSLEQQNPNFKLIATMTGMDKSTQEWTGEQGYITKEMILKYVPEITLVTGYVAGPPGMTVAMRKLLNEAGLDDDYIRSEEFSGY